MAERRRQLLEGVAGIRARLAANVEAEEAAATLSPASVAGLGEAGVLAMKLPAVLGGTEVDPTTQLLVLEALAEVSASASWCTMVGATGIGLAGAFLDEAGIAEVFADGRIPRAATVAMPMGTARLVEGGFRLTGRWPFASGVRHAKWLVAGARVEGYEGPGILSAVFPVNESEIHDNWQVSGLEGTGSCDFSVQDIFVPAHRTWWRGVDAARRGGPLYAIDFPGFVANEHAGFALGLARQALDALLEIAGRRRGYTVAASSLASRAAVQRLIGQGELRLRGARALAIEINDDAWSRVSAGEPIPPRLQGEMRAVASHCTEEAVDIITQAFRYSGGRGIYRASPLQRALRDINVAAQHLMVSEIAYENLGALILDLPDADPMR